MMLSVIGVTAVQAADQFPNARDSDPIALGLMQGAPPPANRLVLFQDGSYLQFPQLRWSFSHWRELRPTVPVVRGSGPVVGLPRAERNDIDAVIFQPMGGGPTMTWAQSLDANYTDGIVVLHRGRIVYERYAGALTADGQHIAHSVTKSFFGTIAAMLIAAGRLDETATASYYLPELKESGFGDATLRQLMDMTSGVKLSEDYANPKAEVWDFARAAGMLPWSADYQGPRALYDFLPTVQKKGLHGTKFEYVSANTEVLVWILRRVTGMTASDLLSQYLFAKLGTKQDAYLQVDAAGTPVGAGGLNLGLRDLARFGEMMRLKGRWNGQQIVPQAVIEEIARGADRNHFKAAGYDTMTGWSYHNQWWISHDDHGSFMARGVYGQSIWIDPKAEMVIARFGSAPRASGVFLDPTTLPAFRALAEHLMKVAP